MRKWCVDCRRVISLEQARARKYGLPSPAFDLRVADVRNDPRKLQ